MEQPESIERERERARVCMRLGDCSVQVGGWVRGGQAWGEGRTVPSSSACSAVRAVVQ